MTVAAPSNAFEVIAFTPPLLKMDVSAAGASGAAGAAPGSVTLGGSGRPVASPPGSGAMRSPVNSASVVAVPSSPTWAWASPAWPYSWPSGLPSVTAPAVLGSVLKASASATNGQVEFVQACTIGPRSGNAAVSGLSCPQATAGPFVRPLPGSARAERAAGPLEELIDEAPETNWVKNVSLIGVRPPSWSGKYSTPTASLFVLNT